MTLAEQQALSLGRVFDKSSGATQDREMKDGNLSAAAGAGGAGRLDHTVGEQLGAGSDGVVHVDESSCCSVTLRASSLELGAGRGVGALEVRDDVRLR